MPDFIYPKLIWSGPMDLPLFGKNIHITTSFNLIPNTESDCLFGGYFNTEDLFKGLRISGNTPSTIHFMFSLTVENPTSCTRPEMEAEIKGDPNFLDTIEESVAGEIANWDDHLRGFINEQLAKKPDMIEDDRLYLAITKGNPKVQRDLE
jgi:hypothetical protein